MQSHPSWVCGLKHIQSIGEADIFLCHTLRGCVDWNLVAQTEDGCHYVTPFVGVWIETYPYAL